MDTNRIEKTITIKAPQARVWKAISDAKEFGSWFKMSLNGAFTPGAKLVGTLTENPPYKGLTFDLVVEKVEPETLLSYRWHPYAVDTKVDYSQEPMTLVELRLAAIEGGTRLTVTETGFDQIPAHRRAEALRMNDGGWAEQVQRVRQYVEK
jgi:uncharacterized protein YndB with AHSA1/START domain